MRQKIAQLETKPLGNDNIERHMQEIKNEFTVDLKAIGKELAVDIVSLNKKIDSK